LIALFLIALPLHPLHISVTEIEFDEKDKALEIMMRVFIDDLETTLRTKINQPELDILNLKGGLTVDQLMRDYLAGHFSIALDGKPQKVKYLGHETDGNAFIFYIEVSNVKKWKTIKVQHDGMTEVFDDQSNLINVTVRGNVKSLRLTKDTPVNSLTFETK
jgi:hypothetical protein